MKIKSGDKVRILAGKDKGKEGVVLQVFVKINRIVVEGVNTMKRHLGVRGSSQKGQIIEFPSPIHVSNVKLISAKSGKSGRVGYKFIDKDGKKTKIRVLRTKGVSEDLE